VKLAQLTNSLMGKEVVHPVMKLFLGVVGVWTLVKLCSVLNV
jgi:hypothetical protein